jgi:hypothetical protein
MKYRAALSIDVIFIPKTSSFCSFFAVKSLHSFARQRRVIFAFVNSSLSPAPTSKLEAGMIVMAVANKMLLQWWYDYNCSGGMIITAVVV